MALRSTPAAVLHIQRAESDRFLPEGPRPVTIDGRSALTWVNIQTKADARTGVIHARFWDTGDLRTYPQARRPGFLLPTTRPNTLFVGREKEVGLLDLPSNSFTPLATIPDQNPRTIINDGEVVPGGRAVVFGTKDVRFAAPIAELYLFTVDDCQISVLAPEQTCSNGKVVARDRHGLALYDIDTPKRNVVRYGLDVAARMVYEPTVVLDVKGFDGFPDGMVDAGDGSVVVAFYNPAPVAAGRAIRFNTRTGDAIEEWTTPGSPRVTCPLMLNLDGRVRLVLTTATEGMPAEMREKCPDAGNLFIVDTGITRAPASEVVRIH
jgi:sugar lactone lactonase YvrE